MIFDVNPAQEYAEITPDSIICESISDIANASQTYRTQKPQSERLTWSLTPHSPAGAFAHKDSASPLLTLSEEKFGRQDLLLRRAMLAGLLPVYVDRFARAWHRLATTDALGLLVSIIGEAARRVKRILANKTMPGRSFR